MSGSVATSSARASASAPHCAAPPIRATDIGVLPADWDVQRIDGLANIKTGSRNTQDRIDDGEYPFFVRSQVVERINSYCFNGEAVLTAGDGVGTGKVFHYINGRFDVHQRVYRISNFSPLLNGKYFFYQFSTRFFDRIMSMTAKSSVDSVRMEMIGGMQIPLPSPTEQRAIATALSDVDSLIASLERLIAKKRAIKQGAMQQLLTGKTRLPGFEGEWERHSFGSLFSVLRSASNSRADLQTDGECGYLHYGDIHSHDSVYFNCGRDLKTFILPARVPHASPMQDGDLVLVDASEDTTAIGKAVEICGLANRMAVAGLHTILLRSQPEVLADGFKGYLQCFGQVRNALVRMATGVSVYGISKLALKSVEVCIPAIHEQRAIARVLADIDTSISEVERRRDKAKAIKKGMMQALLTGRVRLPVPAEQEEKA